MAEAEENKELEPKVDLPVAGEDADLAGVQADNAEVDYSFADTMSSGDLVNLAFSLIGKRYVGPAESLDSVRFGADAFGAVWFDFLVDESHLLTAVLQPCGDHFDFTLVRTTRLAPRAKLDQVTIFKLPVYIDSVYCYVRILDTVWKQEDAAASAATESEETVEQQEPVEEPGIESEMPEADKPVEEDKPAQ